MTATTHTLTVRGAQKTMTLEEIEGFLLAAHEAGAQALDRPTVRIAMSGAIKSMTLRVGHTKAPVD